MHTWWQWKSSAKIQWHTFIISHTHVYYDILFLLNRAWNFKVKINTKVKILKTSESLFNDALKCEHVVVNGLACFYPQQTLQAKKKSMQNIIKYDVILTPSTNTSCVLPIRVMLTSVAFFLKTEISSSRRRFFTVAGTLSSNRWYAWVF